MKTNSIQKEHLLQFRVLFEAQRKQIIQSNHLFPEDFQLQSDDLSDETDLTTRELETSMHIRMKHRESVRLEKINAALRRIDKGTFGECEGCGENIDFKRLQASPTTSFCVTCKETQENQAHHYVDDYSLSQRATRLKMA